LKCLPIITNSDYDSKEKKMAGHSKFANIKHRKGAQDAKRAKVFTKLTREITISAKQGQPDPSFNPRLRSALISARKAGVPREKIETAIKKGSGELQGENYEEMRYEGYGPGGVAMMIDALSDNKNRTASEVRSTFTKNNGNLGEAGSVGFMFDRVGIIEFESKVTSPDEIFEAAVEAGASNAESNDDIHTITCTIDDLITVTDALTTKYGDPESARIGWIPTITSDVSDVEQAESIMKLVEALEDLDDVQYVTGNYIVSDEIAEQL
jgi:YebC/PmpR family DNA-binding regulatory protein